MKTVLRVISREGSEELNGFLGDENDFETIVTHNMILSITFDRYTSYIFKTNYIVFR